MLHGVITVDEAIALGISRRRVYRLVQRGVWWKLFPGVFYTRHGLEIDTVVPRQPRRTQKSVSIREAKLAPIAGVQVLTSPPLPIVMELDEQTLWKVQLAGALVFAGDGSMVSHRAAAKLHGLEGCDAYPFDVTIPFAATHRPKGAYRSTLADSSVTIDGLRVSSIVRTLHDLGAVCPLVVVEQAMESALRGRDRRRPDLWNEALLVSLRLFIRTHPKTRGNHCLTAVLNRRTDTDRPTGSLPETFLWQALFRIGLVAVRQPTVRIVDAQGNRLDIFFPDLALPQFRIIIEIDGVEVHSGQTAFARDLRRQNKLRSFTILRFTALEVFQNPDRVAEEVRRATLRSADHRAGWTVDGISVTYSLNEFVVLDPTRGRA